MFAEKALREMREMLPAARRRTYDEILRQLVQHPNSERRLWLMATIRVLPVLREEKFQEVLLRLYLT